MNDKRLIRNKIRNDVQDRLDLCNTVDSNRRKSVEIYAVDHVNIFYN